MPRPNPSLKFLGPAWFTVAIGLGGFALAWLRAAPILGDAATLLGQALALVTALVFATLVGASLLRHRHHAGAFAADWAHPIRHVFVAAPPLALIVVATLATALFGPAPLTRALWWAGSLGQLTITVWVMSRWWRGNGAAGLQWAAITPALLIPVVGNVLLPLAGVPLGDANWACAQFGIGLVFWPVLVALIGVRILVHGPWPERMRPTSFILIAPPALIGQSALQLGAPLALGWLCWGVALFSLLWVLSQWRSLVALPFSLNHWATSFPVAALTTLSLRLADPGSAFAPLAVALLAMCSLLVAGLVLATLRGLRDGSLLAGETVAAIVAVA
jgi:tellurite resistance protein